MNIPTVCNYAVIRFLPYPETEEFVNIGVVMLDMMGRRFHHRVETTRRTRVTAFFPELDYEVYKAARTLCVDELNRVEQMVNAHNNEGQQEMKLGDAGLVHLFRDVVKPRESLIRYSGIRTVLTDTPEAKLQELFQHYVERQFADRPEYQEQQMQKRLGALLKQQNLDQVYRERTFTDPVTEYQVKFPFVREDDHGFRAIKPLHLAQKEPTKIIDHGDQWCARFERLLQFETHPKQVLFVLHTPKDAKRKRAADEIREKLQHLGAETVPEKDRDQLLRYA